MSKSVMTSPSIGSVHHRRTSSRDHPSSSSSITNGLGITDGPSTPHDHDHDHDHSHGSHSHDHRSSSPHSHNDDHHHSHDHPSPPATVVSLPPRTPTAAQRISPQPPRSPYVPLYSPVRPTEDSLAEEEVGNYSESMDDLPPLPSTPSKQSSSSFAGPPQSSAAAAEEKRRHKRIHSRNLSVFFPRPGQGGGGGADDGAQEVEAPVTEIGFAGRMGQPPQGRELRNGGFKFGNPTTTNGAGGLGANGSEGGDAMGGAKVTGRRGHHHKHSLSHNFFSFMDPSQTNPALAAPSQDATQFWPPISPFTPASATDPNFPSDPSSSFPKAGPNAGRSSSKHLPSPSQLSQQPSTFLGSLAMSSVAVKSMAMFAVLQFALGASLWVDGQAGGSVSVAGLGYLVVFDSLGVMGMVGGKVMDISGGSASSFRYPFGNHRMETLILFVQAIFLLFSSVYICKESIEHVLLLGHHHEDDFFEMVLPNTLLALAFGSALFSALVMKNHAKLVEAVGSQLLAPTVVPPRYRSSLPSVMIDRLLSLSSNPYSLSVLACTGALLFGGLILPSGGFSNLDKAVAILETILTFYISYPASVAFGRVLLQTAPPERAVQMINLNKSLREVEAHPLVVYLPPPHVWRIHHHQASSVLPTPSKNPQTPDAFGPGGRLKPQSPMAAMNAANASSAASSSLLIVTLVVHVRTDASDQNILDVTKFAYDRCAGAVGANRRGRYGGDSGSAGEGELTVEVKRGTPSWTER